MGVKLKDSLERKKPGLVRILNRIVTVTDPGLQCEADQRHAEIVMKGMCIDKSSKGVVAPGVVSTGEGGASLRKRNPIAWRRESIQSGVGETQLPGPRSHGHAVRGEGGVKVLVETRGA